MSSGVAKSVHGHFKGMEALRKKKSLLTLPTAPSPVTTHCTRYPVSHGRVNRMMTHGRSSEELTFNDWVAGLAMVYANGVWYVEKRLFTKK